MVRIPPHIVHIPVLSSVLNHRNINIPFSSPLTIHSPRFFSIFSKTWQPPAAVCFERAACAQWHLPNLMRHIGDEVQQQEQELQGQRTIYDTGRVATHAFFYLETFFFIMLIFVEGGLPNISWYSKTRCSPRTRMLTRMLMVQMSKHMDMQSRTTLFCNGLFEQSCTYFPCYQSAVWSVKCRVWSVEWGVWSL